jgi:hypothetical protein
MAPEGDVAPADMPDDAPGGADSGGLGAGGGGYVPPHLRGRAGAGEKMGGKFDRDDSATLRVTNVSEFAEEQDLRDMFSRYGHVTRVFLAKDRETGRAKGFAFVSYADRTDAAKACEKMDGCKFTLLIRSGRSVLTRLQSVSVISFYASSLRRRLKRWTRIEGTCILALYGIQITLVRGSEALEPCVMYSGQNKVRSCYADASGMPKHL